MISKANVQRNGILWCVLVLALCQPAPLRADEGMWIPLLIDKYQIGQMKEAGLEISAEEIYSVNQACLKDAIVIFGGWCTGELVSREGLLLTNHHCGEEAVQSHSSVQKDYLKQGFWAMSREEELPNQGLSVTFLRYMKDVTGEVLGGIPDGLDPEERDRQVELHSGEVIAAATRGTRYEATVKPFYYGNAYYLFVYEVFRDIRLVGAPPVSIGNFGADLDNWIWPRHTGDFTLFRIYAGPDNHPAEYAPRNKPYKPKKYLEIDAGGVDEGDFTMVLGYPGSTTRYLYSLAVRNMVEKSLPLRIGLRTKRLEVMDGYMHSSDEIRIQYTTKYRDVSNAWKKWQGIILGLNRNNVVGQKIKEEEAFIRWVNGEGMRQSKYDSLLSRFDGIYGELEPYRKAMDLLNEAIMAVELFREAPLLRNMMLQGLPADEIIQNAERFYKDFHMPIDRDVFGLMMAAVQKELPAEFVPAFYDKVERKYKGDFDGFATDLYGKSLFAEKEKFLKLIEIYREEPGRAMKKLEGDPLFKYFYPFRDMYVRRILPENTRLERELDREYRRYMAAQMERAPHTQLPPDANFTMRLTYGAVNGYEPWDGIQYQYSTSLAGIIEKSSIEYEDYRIPDKLRELYSERDFGKYGANGSVPVCFIASNHTSGGNSGSPVLDARGRLVGINFDRNWEGTMSDVYYDPSLCRNIAVDIRYILFIIDKYAGAGYLVDEMDIVW